MLIRTLMNVAASAPAFLANLIILPIYLTSVDITESNSYLSMLFLFNIIWVLQRGGTDIYGPRLISKYDKHEWPNILSAILLDRIWRFFIFGIPAAFAISVSFSSDIAFCLLCAALPTLNFTWYIKSYTKPTFSVYCAVMSLFITTSFIFIFPYLGIQMHYLLISFAIINSGIGLIYLFFSKLFVLNTQLDLRKFDDFQTDRKSITLSQLLSSSVFLLPSIVLPRLLSESDLSLVLFIERLVPMIGVVGAALQYSLNSIYKSKDHILINKKLMNSLRINFVVAALHAAVIILYISAFNNYANITTIISLGVFIRVVFFNHGGFLSQKLVQNRKANYILKVNLLNVGLTFPTVIIFTTMLGVNGAILGYLIGPVINAILLKFGIFHERN